jgi:hypothetical protein
MPKRWRSLLTEVPNRDVSSVSAIDVSARIPQSPQRGQQTFSNNRCSKQWGTADFRNSGLVPPMTGGFAVHGEIDRTNGWLSGSGKLELMSGWEEWLCKEFT